MFFALASRVCVADEPAPSGAVASTGPALSQKDYREIAAKYIASARAAIFSETDAHERDRMFSFLAAAQARMGAIEAAKASTQEISGLSPTRDYGDHYRFVPKDYALRCIAAEQAKVGDMEGVKITIDDIQGPRTKDEARLDILAWQLRREDLAAARATVDAIRNKYFAVEHAHEGMVRALTGIAVRKSAADSLPLLEEALVEAQKCTAGESQAAALKHIVAAFVQLGNLPAARRIADIPLTAAWSHAEHWQGELFGAIAVEQSRMGNVGESTDTLAMIGDAKVTSIATSEAATEQARHGDVSGAKARANLIPLQFWQSRALCGIGEAQTQNGDLNGAKQSLLEAQAIGEKLDDPSLRGIALSRVAVAQAKTGDFVRARSTVESVKDSGWDESALSEIVAEQAKSGDTASGSFVLMAMQYYTESPRRQIIASEARAGRFTNAEYLADSIKDPSIRWRAKLTLAEAAKELAGGRAVSDIAEIDD